jgi:pimeloyl-ACP methyl ester carboxylesterase
MSAGSAPGLIDGYVKANGIDIHYTESGSGPPLVLLHGGIVSSNPIWTGHPFAYASHVESFGRHFRVIAPDARGYGRSVHPGGSIPSTQLADDVVALIEALDLDQPALCGFSDGAVTATLVGIRAPDAARAIVNHSGYDLFNPNAQTFTMMRMTLGGSPDATRADPAAAERFFDSSEPTRATFALMKADHDGARGEGYWKQLIDETFDRLIGSPGYVFEDLRAIVAPTLILTGDRDQFCSVEEASTAFRALPTGELAVLPNHGHEISAAAVRTSIEFLVSSATAA